MRVVYQAYGAGEFHRQARFSALSLLHHDAGRRCAIACYTDRPEPFAALGLDTVTMDPAFIAAGRGRFDFVHRLKLAVLRDAIARFPDADGWMVLDADTQWRAAPDALAGALRAGRALLHAREGPVGPDSHGAIHHALRRMLPAQARFTMLNAGVVGVPPPDAAAAVDEALALTDRLLLRCLARNWLEQAAVSIVLQGRYPVEFAGERILHYWRFNREVDPVLARFFDAHAAAPVPALAAAAAAFDPLPEAGALQARLRARRRDPRDYWTALRRSWGKRLVDLRVLAARVLG